jgi:hypothetical protein
LPNAAIVSEHRSKSKITNIIAKASVISLRTFIYEFYPPLAWSHGLKYDYPLSGLTAKTPRPIIETVEKRPFLLSEE